MPESFWGIWRRSDLADVDTVIPTKTYVDEGKEGKGQVECIFVGGGEEDLTFKTGLKQIT